ncbi:unnamed protein product [Chrysodeixis includens]|uniref:Peptidase S8 pro-domain domain-containing protein n=1 Tax=Chrysodeixis includens TaxID=689277 RepID=A0A9N8KY46_CHRIL|nr:unnamed protein product [Chrysodeixis includens]
MVTSWRALALLAALHACAALPQPVYHNQFAVHVPAGPDHVDDIARRHGFINHGQCSVAYKLRHVITIDGLTARLWSGRRACASLARLPASQPRRCRRRIRAVASRREPL